MLIIITVLAFITTVLLIIGLFKLVGARQQAIRDRLQLFASGEIGPDNLPAKPVQMKKLTWRALLRSTSQVFAARSYTRRLEQELMRANIPLRGEEFIMLNILAGLGGLGLGWILTGRVISAVLLAVLGGIFPWLAVCRTREKRLSKFNQQIGEALTVMTNSLRAGYSFLQTLEMVSREMPSPIADEFGLTLREINLGTTTEEALQNLNSRLVSDDLDLLVTAVSIQRQAGGNLAEVLDNISVTIRERIRIKGEIKTLTAQGRISGLVIGLLPIAVVALIFLINPDYIEPLFTEPVGQAIVAGGIVSEIIGVMLIKKIVSIEV